MLKSPFSTSIMQNQFRRFSFGRIRIKRWKRDLGVGVGVGGGEGKSFRDQSARNFSPQNPVFIIGLLLVVYINFVWNTKRKNRIYTLNAGSIINSTKCQNVTSINFQWSLINFPVSFVLSYFYDWLDNLSRFEWI